MTYQPNIVNAIRETRLASYRLVPRDIVSHFNDEEAERKNYVGRPLLELLQNIEDALAEATIDGAARIELLGDCLYVANEGSPFSKFGLEALCDRSISPKRGKGFIGNKGIGFKAILNWTDAPRVFSGEIHTEFHRELARTEIRNALTLEALVTLRKDHNWSETQIPLLRLPFSAKPNQHEQSLIGHWTTVLALPLKPYKLEEVSRALLDFDLESLVFLRKLRTVEIVVNKERRQITAVRVPENDWLTNVRIVETDKHGEKPQTYKVFRRVVVQRPLDNNEMGGAEVAWAYPGVVPTDNGADKLVYNFFPTKQRAVLPSLLSHGTFLLTPDRNRYREDDREFHKALAQGLATLLRDNVIPSLVRDFDSHCLAFLRLGTEPTSDDTEKVIWDECLSAISQLEFVPTLNGGLAAPTHLKLWADNLDRFVEIGNGRLVQDYLPKGAWQVGVCRNVLSALGASTLSSCDYPVRLENWEARSVDDAMDCLKLLTLRHQALESNIALRTQFIDLAKNIAFVLTRDGIARNFVSTRPLFRSLPSTLVLPAWVEVDVLHEELVRLLESSETSANHSFSESISQLTIAYSQEAFAAVALIPALKDKLGDWWSVNGMQAIALVGDVGFNSTNEVVVLDETRRELSSLVRVLCSDGNWWPAKDVYAGTEWLAPFDATQINRLPQRALLASPEKLGWQTDTMRGLLQYIGVSWWPKLIRERSDGKDGPTQFKECFKNGALAGSWEQYLAFVKKPLADDDEQLALQKLDVSYHRIQEAWGLEGLEIAISGFASTTERLKYLRACWERCPEQVRSVTIRRYGTRHGDRRAFRLTGFDSFVAWQLSNLAAFRPDKTALLASDAVAIARCFLQQPGQRRWMQWLALLAIEAETDVRSAELRTFALQLGARESLNYVREVEWLDWLSMLNRQHSMGASIPIADLRGMLVDMGHQLTTSTKFDKSFELPCITGAEQRLTFVKASDLYVLDEQRLLNIKNALLESGIPLLVSDLADGKRVASCFNIKDRQLSNAVILKVLSTEQDKEGGIQLDNMLVWKPKVLALLEHPNHRVQVEELQANWPIFRSFRPLLAAVKLRDVDLGVHEMPFVVSDGEILVDVDNIWENVAAALLARLGRRDSSDQQALIRLLEKASGSEATLQVQRVLHSMGITDDAVCRWVELVVHETHTEMEAVNNAEPVSVVVQPQVPPGQETEIEVTATLRAPIPRPPAELDLESLNEIARITPETTTPRVINDHYERNKPPEKRMPRHPIDISTATVVSVNDVRRIRGLQAEDWLRAVLQEWLPDGWNLLDMGGGALPFDMAIRSGDVTCYIDSKTDGGEFYLSEREVEFAMTQPERYFVALVGQEQPDGTRMVRWLFDPLGQCREWGVTGRWSFRENPHRETIAPWEVPNPRPTLPEGVPNFSFVIRVPETAADSDGKQDFREHLTSTQAQ